MTTYTINEELNGIEITFTEKPSKNVLESLKSNGFRWHNVKKLWYAKNTAERLTLVQNITTGKEITAVQNEKTAVKNKYGVQVGDIFSASWGYEQTNADFFQVIALVGKEFVRIRQVMPELVKNNTYCNGMASDRTYKLTRDILPPCRTIFIKDQKNGDLKKIKPGCYKDEKKAFEQCQIKIDQIITATKCTGETHQTYESWYY